MKKLLKRKGCCSDFVSHDEVIQESNHTEVPHLMSAFVKEGEQISISGGLLSKEHWNVSHASVHAPIGFVTGLFYNNLRSPPNHARTVIRPRNACVGFRGSCR